MGLPAVASRLPVIERYFGDRVSYAEPGEPASIAAAIEAIRRDPEGARERAERASRRLARWSGESSARTTWDWSMSWSAAGEAVEMARLLLITPARNEASHIERTAARRRRPDPAARPVADRRRRLNGRHAGAAAPPRGRAALPGGAERAAVGDRGGGRPARAGGRGARLQLGARSGPGSTTSPTSASSTPTSSFRPSYFEQLLARFAERAAPRDRRRRSARARARRLAARPGPRLPRARRDEALQPRAASRRSAESRSASGGTRSTRPTRACGATRPAPSATCSPATTAPWRPPTARCGAAPATGSAPTSCATGPAGCCCGPSRWPARGPGASRGSPSSTATCGRRCAGRRGSRTRRFRRFVASELRARMRAAPERLRKRRSGAQDGASSPVFRAFLRSRARRATPNRKSVRPHGPPRHRQRALAAQDLLAIVVVVAAIVAVLSAYRVSPSGLEKRSLQVGAASSQILVDSPGSALVAGRERRDLRCPLDPGPDLRPVPEQPRGAGQDRQADRGPGLNDRHRRALQHRRRPEHLLGPELHGPRQPTGRRRGRRNRLVFTAQEGVPIITVDSQAPTANRAAKLAVASFITLKRYVASAEEQQGIPGRRSGPAPVPPPRPRSRGVTVRELGTPEGGTIGGANDKILMVLAFITVFLLGCAAIIVLPRFLGRWRSLERDRARAVPTRLGGRQRRARTARGEAAGSATRAGSARVGERRAVRGDPAESTRGTLRGARRRRPGGGRRRRPCSPRPRRGSVRWPHAAGGGEPSGGLAAHDAAGCPGVWPGSWSMLWLAPFDSVYLPFGGPVDMTLDRPLLVVLGGVWLLVSGSLAHEPAGSRSPVHWAFGAFVVIAVLSVLVNAETLVRIDMLDSRVKKIALLASYGVFFVLAASILRPSEVRKFVKFMVGAGDRHRGRRGDREPLRRSTSSTTGSDRCSPATRRPFGIGILDSIGRKRSSARGSSRWRWRRCWSWPCPSRSSALIALRRAAAALALRDGDLPDLRRLPLDREEDRPGGCGRAAWSCSFAYRPRQMVRLLPLGALMLVLVHIFTPGRSAASVDQFKPVLAEPACNTVQDRVRDYDAVDPGSRQQPTARPPATGAMTRRSTGSSTTNT